MIDKLGPRDFEKMHDDSLKWCLAIIVHSIKNKKCQKRRIRAELIKRGVLVGHPAEKKEQ